MAKNNITYEDGCNCPNCRMGRIEEGIYKLQASIDKLLKKYKGS
ncbi:MAG: hypothetical protein PHU12_00885 [Candidatus Aenigmarchaeota archaeon]|nr:hypothetical protein [Candidatus Aenigmarchaeota archaeon]